MCAVKTAAATTVSLVHIIIYTPAIDCTIYIQTYYTGTHANVSSRILYSGCGTFCTHAFVNTVSPNTITAPNLLNRLAPKPN